MEKLVDPGGREPALEADGRLVPVDVAPVPADDVPADDAVEEAPVVVDDVEEAGLLP
ncbi:hypothetical protein [Labrenzia sp. OB1]|uniref:hypothetical protein n=1 Tax=Labrenzia sp. OB1 TaxID=1561204 RepID=UPI000ADEA98D|nr:hypothetical protein [Labrenzia sp. OB1]